MEKDLADELSAQRHRPGGAAVRGAVNASLAHARARWVDTGKHHLAIGGRNRDRAETVAAVAARERLRDQRPGTASVRGFQQSRPRVTDWISGSNVYGVGLVGIERHTSDSRRRLGVRGWRPVHA